MTDIEKIKKFITKKHSINCALTEEIMEFIAKVESESKADYYGREEIESLQHGKNLRTLARIKEGYYE